jgi:hypothetical protein
LTLKTKHIVTGIIFTVAVALSASALASTPRPIPDTQEEMKAAVAALQVRVTNERVEFTQRGRQDLVLYSSTPFNTILSAVKGAFRSGVVLPGGFHVAGWAKQDLLGTWTATLNRGGVLHVVEFGADGAGSRVILWGLARRPGERQPSRSLPAPRRPSVTR